MEKIWMKHWPEDIPKEVVFSEVKPSSNTCESMLNVL